MVETSALAASLRFASPDGAPVDGHDVTVRVEREGTRFVDVWLAFTVSSATWAAIDRHAWFHLTLDVRGEIFGGALDRAADVRIEARLQPELLTALAIIAPDPASFSAELRSARLLPALQHTESWFALYVTQGAAPLRTGFRTRHADAAW